MDYPRAADLPEGTVVVHRGRRIRHCDPLCLGPLPWCADDGGSLADIEVDWLLAEGAEVLAPSAGDKA